MELRSGHVAHSTKPMCLNTVVFVTAPLEGSGHPSLLERLDQLAHHPGRCADHHGCGRIASIGLKNQTGYRFETVWDFCPGGQFFNRQKTAEFGLQMVRQVNHA